MKYLITVIMNETQTDDGPLVVSPSGGAVRFDLLDEACDAARALVEGGTVQGAFVQKLVPVALYTGTVEAVSEAPKPESN